MGTSETAINKICSALDEQERTFKWLARKTHKPYKRLLSELKHRTRPLSLEVALAAGEAVGIELPALVDDVATEPTAVAS